MSRIRRKRHKEKRCLFCNRIFEVNDDNTYTVDEFKIYFCIYCGKEQTKNYK